MTIIVREMTSEMTSEKCKQEINQFKEWAKHENIYCFNGDMEKLSWEDVNVSYTEPMRNKLEEYIKSVLKDNELYQEDQRIDNAKMLVKEYKLRIKVKKENVKKEKVVKKDNNCKVKKDTDIDVPDIEIENQKDVEENRNEVIIHHTGNILKEYKIEFKGKVYKIWCQNELDEVDDLISSINEM